MAALFITLTLIAIQLEYHLASSNNGTYTMGHTTTPNTDLHIAQQSELFNGPQHTPPRRHTSIKDSVSSVQMQTTTNNTHSRPLLFAGGNVFSSPQHQGRPLVGNVGAARALFGGRGKNSKKNHGTDSSAESDSTTSSKKRKTSSLPRAGGAMQLDNVDDDASSGIQSGYQTPTHGDMVGGGASALDATPPGQMINGNLHSQFHGPGAPSRRNVGTNEASPLRLFGFVDDVVGEKTIQDAIHRLKTQNTSNAEEVILLPGYECLICQELVNTGDIVRRVCNVTTGHWICQTCCEHAQFPHHACPACRGVKPGEIFIARKVRIHSSES